MKTKKTVHTKSIQLEISFTVEENYVSLERKDFSMTKVTYSSTKIININDGINEIKKNKELDILKYIVDNSKRF